MPHAATDHDLPAHPEHLLDLPLGEAADNAEPELRHSPTPSGPAPGQQRQRRGRGILWFLALLIPLAVAGGYFLRREPPAVALSVPLVEFAATPVGERAEASPFTLLNRGEKRLQVLAVVVVAAEGEMAEDFSVVEDACTGQEIAAEMTCALRLALQPVAVGSRRAALRIETNAPNSPHLLPLIGEGTAARVRVEPPALDFGSLTIGTGSAAQAVAVTNHGSATMSIRTLRLAGRGAGDFITRQDGCSRQALAPGEQCGLQLAFVPTVVGDRLALLHLESDALEGAAPLQLRGVGLAPVPQLAIDTATLDFGSLRVGATSEPLSVVLTNEGTGPLHIVDLRLPADGRFTLGEEDCRRSPVAPAAGCSVNVIFHSQQEGEAEAILEIEHDAGETATAVRLAGIGIAPGFEMTPRRLSFGEVPVRSTTAPLPVRLTNAGTAVLNVESLGLEGADRRAFTLEPGGCTAALAPGASCEATLRFRPQRAGPHRAEVSIRHDAGEGRARLPVNGFGVAGRLGVEPAVLQLGEVAVGEERGDQLTLINDGRAPLRIATLRLEGGRRSGFTMAEACAGKTLAPGRRCAVTVRFRPAEPGARRSRLLVEHDGEGGRAAVEVQATGTPPPRPIIFVEPLRVDFAAQRIGAPGEILTITVRNRGTGRLELGVMRIAGLHGEDFRIVPGSCEGASFVAPGTSCTVGVRFTPSAAGAREAHLIVPLTDAPGETRTVALYGSGQGDGP